MNFSIHVDDALGEALQRLAKQTGRSRNALITDAIRELLARDAARGWPATVRRWLEDPAGGACDVPPFESHRGELGAPDEPDL